MMKNERLAGVLMHPTSLPGPYGIGDFGPEAYKFADFLANASAGLWQILPMGPTGYGNSPYSARSTFAGNILLISMDVLMESGYLERDELADMPDFRERRIDFRAVETWKVPLLFKAAKRFRDSADDRERRNYEKFCREQAFWLEDYAVFASAVDEIGDSRWFSHWDRELGFRDPEALQLWQTTHSREIELRKVLQYFFFTQWLAIKSYANARGVELVGDIPIFVAADSADAWVNLHLFKTDTSGRFSVQSGVPPDFFSATGQLWGTPLYNWEEHEEELMQWWLHRIRHALRMTDIIRIDHFRGLESYWEVAADDVTAIDGRWVKAPGDTLFSRMQDELGEVPVIAEDLGVMTPEVAALRDNFALPGMKILQFAFDRIGPGELDPANDFLPHNYSRNCVAYTGTHDNDTTLGWFEALDDADRDVVRRYLARPDDDMVWSMIRAVMASVARYAVFPMQDLLSLGTDCRMNKPATVGDENWSWRMLPGENGAFVDARFREMVRLYGRIPQ